MPRILAFDIGIKNLAWCCLERQRTSYRILGWDNYNLLSDESNVGPGAKAAKCSQCSAKGAYQVTEALVACSRHCPAIRPALRDLSGALLKRIPKLDACKAILEAKGLASVPKKKAQILEELQKAFCLPIAVKKVSKAPDANLTDIHNGIQRLVSQQRELWSTCDQILLENQPVLKNPTMKSVQILLFATLRDMLTAPPPPLRLVHAGKKVQGAAKGDAGYKDRKAGSEARAEAFLKDPNLVGATPWQAVWSAATKKSDLADAISMCWDAAAAAAPVSATAPASSAAPA